jgi:hypothetical protein
VTEGAADAAPCDGAADASASDGAALGAADGLGAGLGVTSGITEPRGAYHTSSSTGADQLPATSRHWTKMERGPWIGCEPVDDPWPGAALTTGPSLGAALAGGPSLDAGSGDTGLAAGTTLDVALAPSAEVGSGAPVASGPAG